MQKHSIISIIEHYGGKAGREREGWYKVQCPFHDDSHASATINIEYEAFNCFGCGAKGDAYKLIMEQEGVGFREAYTLAERIAREGGYPLPEVNTQRRGVSRQSGVISSRRSYSPPGLGRRTSARS